MPPVISRESIVSFIREWRKPIIIVMGAGVSIGLLTLLGTYLRKRQLTRKEVVINNKEKPKSLSNRIVILGLDGSGKTALLAALTRQPFSQLTKSDGFYSVVLKSHLSDKTLEFVEVPGKADNRQYWPKFTHLARVILIVVDVNDLNRLNELTTSISSCVNEAKKLGTKVYFVLNTKVNSAKDAPLEVEKYLCLEGFVKDPSKDIFVVTLPHEKPPIGVDKIELVIEKLL